MLPSYVRWMGGDRVSHVLVDAFIDRQALAREEAYAPHGQQAVL